MKPYFTRRDPVEPPDYEEAYWGTPTDPDGVVRDRLAEGGQYLDDAKQEREFLESLPGGRIVDIGCGPGFMLSGLSDKWDKHGVEISEFATNHAKQFGTIHLGTTAAAEFPDDHFDVVFIHHVIEHLEDPVAELIEMRRILKPGGWLIIGTPDFDSGLARRFGEKFRLLHDPTHISLFSTESMYRFVRDHGFDVEKVEYPFFETRHFTPGNLLKMFDTSVISPPFYGGFMTFYTRKR